MKLRKVFIMKDVNEYFQALLVHICPTTAIARIPDRDVDKQTHGY